MMTVFDWRHRAHCLVVCRLSASAGATRSSERRTWLQVLALADAYYRLHPVPSHVIVFKRQAELLLSLEKLHLYREWSSLYFLHARDEHRVAAAAQRERTFSLRVLLTLIVDQLLAVS